MSLEKKLGKVGLVARFKPLHNGGATMLEALCEQAEYVIIGIGSSNKYNARNPFTAEESKAMVEVFLSPRYSNYTILLIPDYGHVPEYSDGQRWKQEVRQQFGSLDAFISGNPYVTGLLQDSYPVVHPVELVPEDKRVRVSGTMVRIEMAKGGNWRGLVPEPVAAYLEKNGLVERFRQEFGLQTLAQLAERDYQKLEDGKAEKLHVQER
ncbi:hypothetical protein HYS48_04230 [Candidatus Woesearchaeota archaeon]|nr:hypothetical protein [Candidatus Woesearchaeota archaeon]